MRLLPELMEKFGMTKNEAKVYSAILALENPKASEIIRYCKVPRTKLYEITRSLHRKGFIVIVPDRVHRFRAISFDTAAQSFIEEREKHLQALKESKKRIEVVIRNSLKGAKDEEPTGRFTIYKARNAINKKMQDIIKNASSDLFMLMGTDDLNYISYLKRKFTKDGIRTKILTPVTEKSMNVVKRWLHLDIRDYSEISLKIIGSEKEILVFQRDEPTALYTEDKKFIYMMKSFFEHAWNTSTVAVSRINEIKTGKPAEEIKYVRNQEEYYEAFKNLIGNASSEICIMTTSRGLVRMHNYVFSLFKKAKKKGCKIKFLIPITEENKDIAKEFSALAELRHTPNVNVAITIFDNVWGTLSELKFDMLSIKNAGNVSIITNQKGMMNIIRHMYDSLWAGATELGLRINEIEQGIPTEMMSVIRGSSEVYAKSRELIGAATKSISVITTERGLGRGRNYGILPIEKQKGKAGIKIRYIMPVTRNNIAEVKEYLQFAEVRHQDFIPIRMKMLDRKDIMLAHGDEKVMDTTNALVLYSNNKNFINTMGVYFENIWNDSVQAEKKIAELESGKQEYATIHMTPDEGFKKSMELISRAKREVLISTSRTSIEKFLKLDLESLKKNGVAIKFILPITAETAEYAKKLASFAEAKHAPTTNLRATIIDSKEAVTAIKTETDIKESVYSNDINFVGSLMSFFHGVWEDGMDASMRLQELEGPVIENETTLIISRDEIDNTAQQLNNHAHKSKDLITTAEGIARSFRLWFPIDKMLRARNVKIRILTEITSANLAAVQQYMDIAEIRHIDVKDLPRLNMIDNKEGFMVFGKDDGPENIVCMWSNNLKQINMMLSYFERLWKNARPAEDVIETLISSSQEPYTTPTGVID